MESIDIRYIDIVWNADRSVLKVEASSHPIELERVEQHWVGNTVAYPQKYFYIGICIADKLIYEPYLKLPNNGSSPLMPIKVPGEDKIWWVQKGNWDTKHNKYFSTIYHTAGCVEISVQNETLILENHTVNFSVSDLEYYLSDLKNKLWMLILDNKSASKIKIQNEAPSIFSEDIVKLFGELTSSFEAIVKKPHVILSEVQEKLPKRLVKPVAKTFREIVTQPHSKRLTSRSYKESYDIPENRFVHYLMQRTLYLLNTLSRLAYHQVNAMHDRVERDEHWLKTESRKETKVVDPVIFDNEIQAITSELENQSLMLNNVIKAQQINRGDENFIDQTYTVTLNNTYGKSDTDYFVLSLNGKIISQDFDTYVVFSSGINFKELCNEKNLTAYEFRITGSGKKYRDKNSNGKIFYRLCFTNIHAIDILRSPLTQELTHLKSTRVNLANNEWVTHLTPDEQESIRNQIQITQARLDAIKDVLNQLSEFNSHIPSLITRVKKTMQFFRTHKVKQQQSLPNSMIFVKNPLYTSVKSAYQQISNLEGMDDSLLNDMMTIDEIGLVNLPNLYERWCLLQLIIVIKDIYRFQAQHNWQQKLIDSILKNKRNIEISFSCKTRQLALVLTYEKELDSGKRPDFVIDLHYETYFSKPDTNAFSSEHSNQIQWYINKHNIKRMVLDAKFRGNVSEHHINNLIDDLYGDKNYSEDRNNSVFIVHPVANVIDIRTSPLAWGKYCNYGHARQINHKKGAIYLSPSREHRNSIENLQRLIGMFLQNHTVILDDGNRKNITWHNKNCISCGSNDLIISLGETKAGNNVNKIHCKSCGQNTIETLCASCRRPLYKNGINWTYHRTRATQTTNIVCPECETFLSSNGRESQTFNAS